MKKIVFFISFVTFNVLLFSQNNIDVKNYSINLDFTEMSNQQISGFTDIKIQCISQVTFTEFQLDLLKLNVDSVLIYNESANFLPLKTTFTYNDTILTVSIPSTFPYTPDFNVIIYYYGQPIQGTGNFGGFYFSGNYAFNMGVSLNDIPHNFGKVWFPCNDNFTDRATYNFNITTNANYFAACNGELLDTIENQDGTLTYQWRLNEEIPTYLASVAVSNFNLYSDNYQSINGNNIPINIYAVNTNNVAGSFVNLKSALSIFEDKFGEYRWNKVGYVVVPFNAGAMEHATNIAIGTTIVNGKTTYEDVFYHELAHLWFGDLITCRTAEDMWINEGLASYCETIFREFHYGKENGKNFRRSSHYSVVKDLSYDEGGFRPISPMPQDMTYSSHVYEKGASVAHALRGYLGDDLFFPAIKQFIADNAFSDVSSEDLRDFLTTFSGIDMTDFFNDWVFTGGFVHYSIDSVVSQTTMIPEDRIMTVYLHQKLRGRDSFANFNRVELTFMDANYDTINKIMEFDGEFGEQTFNFNGFYPIKVFCDFNERLSDATFDTYKFVKTSGTISLPNTALTVTAISVPTNDSAFIRVTHNLVEPDDFKAQIPGLFLIKSRYWLVEGIFPDGFTSNANFTYNNASSSHLDADYITNAIDSMVLLYRPNAASDWQIESANLNKTKKTFSVDSLKLGEYCFGIKDWQHYMPVENNYKTEKNIIIYPNPTTGQLTIRNYELEIDNFNCEIYDIIGHCVAQFSIINSPFSIDISHLQAGIYYLKIGNETVKIIKN